MNKSSSGPLFTPAKTQRASEAIYNQIYPNRSTPRSSQEN